MLGVALAAPGHRQNAVNTTGRLAVAFLVFVMTVNGVTTGTRLRAALWSAAASGVVVAGLAILEYQGWPAILDTMRIFRSGVAYVGGHVRASGPLQYPTIASMYLEMAFALTLGLLVSMVDRRRMAAAAVVLLALALMAQGIILTFTRAGLITMGTSLAIVAALRFREQRRCESAIGALGVLAVVVGVLSATSHSAESLRLRMSTEGQEEWYRASVDAPLDVRLATNATVVVPVRVTNTGLTTWDPSGEPRFRFSYHWLNGVEDRVVAWEGERTDFPAPVEPGETVSLAARVRTPRQPGQYRLMWDVEQETRLWFSTEPEAPMFVSRAVVSGAGAETGEAETTRPMPRTTARPRRFVLWRAAARMIAARPIAGVGLDNFRLLYGAYAGLANPDPRVHTNNMYLELLVGGGILGGTAAFWFFWRAGAQVRRAAGLAGNAPLAAGIVAAGVAIALHGLVDSFVSFTPTYTFMATVAGLTVAAAQGAASEAHRV
jgi:hypothetical protein